MEGRANELEASLWNARHFKWNASNANGTRRRRANKMCWWVTTMVSTVIILLVRNDTGRVHGLLVGTALRTDFWFAFGRKIDFVLLNRSPRIMSNPARNDIMRPGGIIPSILSMHSRTPSEPFVKRKSDTLESVRVCNLCFNEWIKYRKINNK